MKKNHAWQPVIGLELHVQLNTRTKLFCADEAAFGQAPNTRISEVSLGYPGTLPVLNKEVVGKAVLLGLACGSKINDRFYFERKNYTYPDLPKGYQLTQSRLPVCEGGGIPVRLKEAYDKRVPLIRIQIEEDAGKSLHDVYDNLTALDFNRAGTALLEIVTHPSIHSPEEAGAVVAELRRMVRYLGISDGNMEEGSLRCDANISMRPSGSNELGTRVEIKNLNSIRFLQQALAYEITRQTELLREGKKVMQETRLFNASSGQTFAMRTKEELNDYRYFPEPDLPEIVLDHSFIEKLKTSLPELPHQLYIRYVNEYNIPPADAAVLVEEKELTDLFGETVKLTGNPRASANWIIGPVRSLGADKKKPNPARLAEVIALTEAGKVSFAIAARELLPFVIIQPEFTALTAAEHLGIIQTADKDVILPLVQEVLGSYPDKVREYQKGKKGLLGFFMGEIQKRSRQKTDPAQTRNVLERLLNGD